MSYARIAAMAACVIVLLTTLCAYAQSDYGSIAGFVKDPSGATVPKTKMVKNEGNDEQRSTLTNDAGYYVIPNLQPGYYIVTPEANGFKKADLPEPGRVIVRIRISNPATPRENASNR